MAKVVKLTVLILIGMLLPGLSGCTVDLSPIPYKVVIGEDSTSNDNGTRSNTTTSKPSSSSSTNTEDGSQIPPKGTGYWQRSGNPILHGLNEKTKGFSLFFDGFPATTCRISYSNTDINGKRIEDSRQFSWSPPPDVIIAGVEYPFMEISTAEPAKLSYGMNCDLKQARIAKFYYNLAGSGSTADSRYSNSREAELKNEKMFAGSKAGDKISMCINIYYAPRDSGGVQFEYPYEWMPNN